MTEAPDRYHVARSFHASLMRSQWMSADKLMRYQDSQLQQMLAHAAAQVPFYEKPLSRIKLEDGRFDLTRWQELPVISRATVETDYEAFQARSLPPGHQSVLTGSTSGSEGASFNVRKTRFEHTGVACASFRYADWFGYDYATPLAMIRSGFIRPENENDPEDKVWGPPWMDVVTRGARHRLHIDTPLDEQLDWLATLGRVYVNTLPSNAMVLAQRAEERGVTLQIAGFLTVGEKLSQNVRNEVRRIFGCRISDVYSTAECGLIAIECPDSGNYHLQPEISKVEVLDQAGKPCAPGETGNIVATSLYNFAMPLIRYRFNDLVTTGDSCICGRGLPVISKILGRESGLFKLADGRVVDPAFSTLRIKEITGARSWQMLQTSPQEMTVKLQLADAIRPAQGQALRAYVNQALDANINVSIECTNSFPRSKGGKFYPVMRSF
jgi:phenylacetate-CoA ligase